MYRAWYSSTSFTPSSDFKSPARSPHTASEQPLLSELCESSALILSVAAMHLLHDRAIVITGDSRTILSLVHVFLWP